MTSTVQPENQKAIDNALFKKLQQLNMKIPSDPKLYEEDVRNYSEMFKKEFQLVQADTMRKNQRYGELLIFIARCIVYFPAMLGYLPASVMSLMNELGKALHPYNRRKSVAAVMILRAKNILYPVSTIQFLLRQCNIEDKQLRKMVSKYILNDVRRMNKHHQNNKINQELRKFIGNYAAKHGDKTAQKSIQLMVELYRRNVWNDARTVNIIAEGCFNELTKIKLLAAHFLISTTEKLEEFQDSEDQAAQNPSDIYFKKGITKHTKNKEKQVEKEKRRAARRFRKREIAGQQKNFMPIDLIYNPQSFCQKLFNIMTNKSTKYVHKLVYMSLIARLIWRHRLIVLPFYGALVKYLDPKQKEVHRVLTYFAESVHQLIPDGEVQSIVKHIIEHFVNDRCSEFAMTIGLNTLRAVFEKLPSIISEDMMQYLCSYYDYRNKNVSMAAKALINLVRTSNPQLLQKKYRGKHAGQQQQENQVVKVQCRLPGAQFLQQTGDFPVEMDRILTDDDFKLMRKMLRKREEKRQSDGIDQLDQLDEEVEQENENQIVVDQNDSSDEEEEELDCQEVQQMEKGVSEEEEQGQEEEQQQEEGQQEQEDEGEQDENSDAAQEQQDAEEEQSELEYEIDQQGNAILEDQEDEVDNELNIPNKAMTNIAKTTSKENKIQLQSDSSQEQSESNDNPHGFIDVARISFYKKSKREQKIDKKAIKEGKEKFKHKPKEKKGGSTNTEKRKFKPLMMLRSKKNKIRSKQKQMKTRIKSLKTQLGKVRSGKQAKRLKDRVVKTR